MNGKIVGISIVGTAAIAGAALYYLQVFHFYDRLAPEEVSLSAVATDGSSVPLDPRGVAAIDATSSPIRFRACFTLAPPPTGELAAYDRAEPLTAPFWFDCFDAAAIGAALASGEARAVLGETSIAHGVDRVLALFPDGRGYAWHQLNPEFAE